MLIQYRNGALVRAFSIGLLFACAPTFTLAQDADAEPYFLTFRIHTVKPDQVAAWESVMKERRDVEEAAGRPFRRVFERIRGEGNTFLILHHDSAFHPEFPPAPASATWAARLNSTTESRTTLTVQMYPELEANLDRWFTEDTDLLQVRLRTNAPGLTQDYHDWQANELFPALDEAGVTIRGGRLYLGGSSRQWVRLSVQEDWASLMEANPVLESRDFQRMLAAGEEMIVSTVDLMYRHRADLSFVN